VSINGRLSVLLLVASAVLLMCGGDQCDVDCDEVRSFLLGTFACTTGVLESVVPREDDQRVFSAGQLTLGPSTSGRAVDTSQTEADFAEFFANREGGTPVYMTGTFDQDGNDVTVHLTAIVTAQMGTPESIQINLTFTDDDHASGTLSYTESSVTFEGDIDIERQGD
jgi:hypothetical protein